MCIYSRQREKMGNADRYLGQGKWMCMVGKQGWDKIWKEKERPDCECLECPTKDLKEIPFCMQLASFFFGNSIFRFPNRILISKIYQKLKAQRSVDSSGKLYPILFFFFGEVEISVYTLDLGNLPENNLFVGESSFTCWFFLAY